jgi:hypothetical protein
MTRLAGMALAALLLAHPGRALAAPLERLHAAAVTGAVDLPGRGLEQTVRAATSTEAWSFRAALIVGWTLTGALVSMTGGPRFVPWPAAGFAGWLAFEWALAATPPIVHVDGPGAQEMLSLALRANLAAMAVMLTLASTTTRCSTGGCFQRDDVDYSLSFRSGISRMISMPLNLIGDVVWKRALPGTEKRWRILVAPVMHDDRVTGAGIGFSTIL